jgi:RecB family exonuclease
LAPVSSTQPLFAEGSIPVSPSALGAIEASPLDWFVSLVARNDPAPSRGVGLLLHQAWEHNLDGDAEDMWREVDRRFGELEYESGWVEGYHKRLAHGMVQALADYTRDRRTAGASVLAIEASFQIEHQRVRLRGMIDRLERLESGEVLVVDLKTGSSQRDKDVVDNPQMLSYQMALDSEEIRKMVGEKLLVSAGAVLVFVKEGVNGKSYRLATQTPLTPEAREAFLSRIEQAAELMSRHEFGGAPRAFGPPGTPARHRWHAIGQVTDEV